MPHLRPKLCVRFAHVARCRFTCITRPACACAPLGRRVADPDFRGLQDELVDELYFFPAMTIAGKVGIVTPLGQMIMWDTMIQHGAGGDNGTRAIIKETQRNKGTIGQDESAWLDAFLDVRLRHLVDMYRGTTENADVSSESRVEALRSLLQEPNLALELPLNWEVYGDRFELPASDD
jgi:chitosanase